MAVLLSIPFFLGRGLYRALTVRKRIDDETPELTFASARIVGFTKRAEPLDLGDPDHFAIVEYEATDGVVWAETLACERQEHEVGDVIDIMCRPKRPRSVMIAPSKRLAYRSVGFEKYFDLIMVLIGICIMVAMVVDFFGLSRPILGAVFAALCAGFGFGYLAKGWVPHDERADAEDYRRRCDRLKHAQAKGVVPCELQE